MSVGFVAAVIIWYGATAINSFSSKELVKELQPTTPYECLHFTLVLTLCQSLCGVLLASLLTLR
jgi:hypothetical protein